MASDQVPRPPLLKPPPPPELGGLEDFGQPLRGIPSEGQLRYGSDAVADYARSLDASLPQLDDLSLADLSAVPEGDDARSQMHPAQAAALADAQALAAHRREQENAAKAAKAKAAAAALPVPPAPPARSTLPPPPSSPPPSAFLPPEQAELEEDLVLALDPREAKLASPASSASLETVDVARVASQAAEDGGDGGRTAAELASAALLELAGQLEKTGGLHQPSTEDRGGGPTGAHAVVGLPHQSASDLPRLALARMVGPSPSPLPQRTGLFSHDLIVNSCVAALIGLLLGLYPGYESARRVSRDRVEPLLEELEGATNAPLEVRAGKLREPRTVAADITAAEGEVTARFYTLWLACGVPIGLLLGFVRRRPRR